MRIRCRQKIVMVAYTVYPSDARVRREAETMAALEGHEVTVLVLKERSRARRYRLEGVEVIELNIRKYRGKHPGNYFASYFNFLLRAWGVLTRRFLRRQVDVVHVHNMPNILVLAAIVPKLCGKRIILDIHDSMPETFAAKFQGQPRRVLLKLLQWEERISARLADRIICVNHLQKQAIGVRGRIERPVSVVLNVPDPKWFPSMPASDFDNAPLEGFNIVYHGTITRRLGIDLALEAVRRLQSFIAELHFFILGTGEDLEELNRLGHTLGIEDRVHFNGKMLPVDKLLGKLTDMNLGLIANRRSIATELMLPVKMLEYFALGIPVVAPRLKTIEYYCDDGMVSFYEPEQIDAMVQAILKLYTDPDSRRQQATRAGQFLEQYGWDRHKSELVAAYQF